MELIIITALELYSKGKKCFRGLTGIEPATSSTQRKNHTARPKTQLIILMRKENTFHSILHILIFLI